MSRIHFTVRGNGQPVVLIHGFPLNSKVWDDFAARLAQRFRVYTPDLPGFGESPILKSGFTINDVATEIITWLEKEKIQDPVIVGHSLGGYVALAIAKARPDIPSGIVLFHSTAYPDSEEKKENRNKALDFIGKNGVDAFTSNFIAPLFADKQHLAVTAVRDIATTSSAEAVTGYIKAMRDRESRVDVLKDFPRPVMIISGEKDGGIPVESVQKQASESHQVELHVLENVGHMGMFESPEATAYLIRQFIAQSNRPYPEI